jgi:hypothetical protein
MQTLRRSCRKSQPGLSVLEDSLSSALLNNDDDSGDARDAGVAELGRSTLRYESHHSHESGI